jgi:hypothetical protein
MEVIWYHNLVLNCTWDDMEAETALRKLGVQLDEQQRAEQFYLKLREADRMARPAPGKTAAKSAE